MVQFKGVTQWEIGFTVMDVSDIFIPFINEIDELPPAHEYHRRTAVETPPEIQVELERTKESREAEFRSWLIKNKPKNALMTAIETNTTAGVPDIFSCYQGYSCWIECKSVINGIGRIRGTQYSYLKKLLAAGGNAKIIIQGLSTVTYKPVSISIYDAQQIATLPLGLFKIQGKEMIFPPDVKPKYKWYYNRNKKESIDDLYLHVLLDINEFED